MFIECGILDIRLLILLIFPIVVKVLEFLPEDNNKGEDKENPLDNPLFRSSITYSSMTFCGILHLISICLKKTDKQTNEEEEEAPKKKKSELEMELFSKDNKKLGQYQIEILKQKEKQKAERKKKFFFILLIALMQIPAIIIQTHFKIYINAKLKNNISIFSITLYFVLFSMCFLRLKLYIHQYISFGILFIISFIFAIETVCFDDKASLLQLFYSFLYFSCYEVFYTLIDVLGKKYLNTSMDGVYLFLFKMGIIPLVCFVTYDVIAYFFFPDLPNGIIDNITHNFNPIYLLTLFRDIIFEIGLWLTIYYFSPCHFIIINVLLEMCVIGKQIIKKEETNKAQIITYAVLYPVLFFAILIFNEIIILNFCGLNLKTKKYLMKSADSEIKNDEISRTDTIISIPYSLDKDKSEKTEILN